MLYPFWSNFITVYELIFRDEAFTDREEIRSKHFVISVVIIMLWSDKLRLRYIVRTNMPILILSHFSLLNIPLQAAFAI